MNSWSAHIINQFMVWKSSSNSSFIFLYNIYIYICMILYVYRCRFTSIFRDFPTSHGADDTGGLFWAAPEAASPSSFRSEITIFPYFAQWNLNFPVVSVVKSRFSHRLSSKLQGFFCTCGASMPGCASSPGGGAGWPSPWAARGTEPVKGSTMGKKTWSIM